MADKIKVERANPYARPNVEPSLPSRGKKVQQAPPPDDDDTSSALVIPAQLALFAQEAAAHRERITQLELHVREIETERRADLERLLREIADLKATIARLEAEQRAAKPAE